MDSCENTPKRSYTEKKAIHVPSRFSILTCLSFDKSKNEQKYYRAKDCMKQFSLILYSIINKLINYKQKAMIALTDVEKAQHNSQKVCFLRKKEFCYDKTNKKEYKLLCKVRDQCHFTGRYRGAAHSNCNLKYKVPKFVPVVFHNGSTYDNHFIIKQLAKDFNGYFSCIGENTEKYISFSITIFKESANATGKKKSVAFSLRFIDSYRHMDRSLDALVKNLAEPGKNISIDVLKQRLYNTYQLCDNNTKKFKLLLRKSVYPYEYMDLWNKFKELKPFDKNTYYSKLYDEGISDNDIDHVKNVCNTFQIYNLGKHDLYVQSDVSLLADVFENFRDKCLTISELDPAYHLYAPRLPWQSCLKKTCVKLELLTDINMLLLFENSIHGGICTAVHKYAKANNKYMKNYDISKQSTYLMHVDPNNLYGYAMSKKLPVDDFST